MQFSTLWDTLVEPDCSVQDPSDRRRARLEASLLVVLDGFIFLSVSVQLAVGSSMRELGPIVFAMVPLFFFYRASRTSKYRMAALGTASLVIMVCFVVPFLRPEDPIWAPMTTLAVLFASIFVTVRQLKVLALMAVAQTGAILAILGNRVDPSHVIALLMYQVLAVLLLCVMRAHRDAQERERVEMIRRHQEQLAKARRIETFGRLAGGVAHDFNNMLTVICANTLLMAEEGVLNEAGREMLGEIQLASDQAAAMVGRLLSSSRRQVTSLQVLDLCELIKIIRPLLERVVGDEVRLQISTHDQPLYVLSDATQVKQVLINLVSNASRASNEGELVTVVVRPLELDAEYAKDTSVSPDTYAVIDVVDHGCGMSKEVVERVFDPFFTTQEDERGTGLGLASVWAILEELQGQIRVESTIDVGSTFHVLLPLSESSSTSFVPGAQVQVARILVVDDDALVLAAIARLLTQAGYEVMRADSVRAAIKLVEAVSGDLDLVLTDVIMPDERGTELVRFMCESHPRVKVSYMSAYAGADQDELKGIAILPKPFSPESALAHVSALLSA